MTDATNNPTPSTPLTTDGAAELREQIRELTAQLDHANEMLGRYREDFHKYRDKFFSIVGDMADVSTGDDPVYLMVDREAVRDAFTGAYALDLYDNNALRELLQKEFCVEATVTITVSRTVEAMTEDEATEIFENELDTYELGGEYSVDDLDTYTLDYTSVEAY